MHFFRRSSPGKGLRELVDLDGGDLDGGDPEVGWPPLNATAALVADGTAEPLGFPPLSPPPLPAEHCPLPSRRTVNRRTTAAVTDASPAPRYDAAVLQGRNRLLAGGRWLAGADPGHAVATGLAIVLPLGLFYGIPVRYLFLDVSLVAGIVVAGGVGVPAIIALWAFVATATDDPGILLRSAEAPADADGGGTGSMAGSLASGRGSSTVLSGGGNGRRVKQVLLHGVAVKVKYCETCRIWRPPRAHHCSVCNNCYAHYDHHCAWLGTCVARRNYRTFYLFIATLTLVSGGVIGACVWAVVAQVGRSPQPPLTALWVALSTTPVAVTVLLIPYAALACLFTSALVGLHTYLLLTNKTTAELFKRLSATPPPASGGGTMDGMPPAEARPRGLRRAARVLCGGRPPSRVKSKYSGPRESLTGCTPVDPEGSLPSMPGGLLRHSPSGEGLRLAAMATVAAPAADGEPRVDAAAAWEPKRPSDVDGLPPPQGAATGRDGSSPGGWAVGPPPPPRLDSLDALVSSASTDGRCSGDPPRPPSLDPPAPRPTPWLSASPLYWVAPPPPLPRPVSAADDGEGTAAPLSSDPAAAVNDAPPSPPSTPPSPPAPTRPRSRGHDREGGRRRQGGRERHSSGRWRGGGGPEAAPHTTDDVNANVASITDVTVANAAAATAHPLPDSGSRSRRSRRPSAGGNAAANPSAAAGGGRHGGHGGRSRHSGHGRHSRYAAAGRVAADAALASALSAAVAP
ncbi:hypothetical protein MMPV_008791 [Pyropia vietnamensis]